MLVRVLEDKYKNDIIWQTEKFPPLQSYLHNVRHHIMEASGCYMFVNKLQTRGEAYQGLKPRKPGVQGDLGVFLFLLSLSLSLIR